MPSTAGIVASSRDEFTPLQYSPYRWYDMSDPSTFTYSSSTGMYIGPNGLTSVGVAANYCSLSVSPNLFGDLEIICKVSLSNWAGTSQTIMSCGSNAYGFSAYTVAVSGGVIQFSTYIGGGLTYSSGSLPSWTANSVHWLRVKREQTTGYVSFFESDDGVTWSQLGSTVNGATGLIDGRAYSGAPFYIGAHYSGGFVFSGSVQALKVWDGLQGAGNKVVDLDFTAPYALFSTVVYDTAQGARASVTSTTSISGASGGLVRTVADKSGNGRDAVQSEGYFIGMPHAAGGEYGFIPSLYFDGGDWLTSTSSTTSPFMIFAVFRRTVTPGLTSYLFDTTQRLYVNINSSSAWGSPLGAGNTYYDVNLRTIGEFDFSPTGAIKFDSVRNAAGAYSTTTSTDLFLMARYSSTEQMTGYLCEFIQFGTLNLKQIQIVREYLRKKWNVAG